MSKLKDDNIDFLFRALMTLETLEEYYEFFEDLCTVPELSEMSKRLRAADMLHQNNVYTHIAAETTLSTATISRVNRCLKYGSGGYKKVLEKLQK